MLWRLLRGLRRRLLWVFIAFGLGASLTWYFRTDVFALLLAPAQGRLSETGAPIFTGPTEMLALTIRMTIKGGVVAAVPMVLFHVARLIGPTLGKRHRRFLYLFLPACFIFYLAGAAFAYFVLLPTGIGFLLRFGAGIAVPMIRITEYMDIALAMIFWLGAVFEIPLVMLMLAKTGIVSHERMKRLRPFVPVGALILSAFITPTFDMFNQILVAVPITLLYEAGLLLAWAARPKHGQP